MVEIKEGEMNEEFLQYYICQTCGESRILEGFIHCPGCGQVIETEEKPWYFNIHTSEFWTLMENGKTMRVNLVMN